MTQRIFEWRILKNGEEVFRTRSRKELTDKVIKLDGKNIAIQTRSVRYDGHGGYLYNWNGEPMWTSWS